MKKYLTVALKAVEKIRPLLQENFGNPDTVEYKEDGSFVTNVDPEAEKIVRDVIRSHFPDHGILGEEIEQENPNAELKWIIDPIDGTKQFIRGIPVYGCIIALYKNEQPLVAVIDVPETGSLYHAIKGEGAYLNGKKITIDDVSEDEVLEGCLAVSGRSGFLKTGVQEAYDELWKIHPEVMTLPNCYGHGLAVEGVVTAMVNFNISIWDIAATKLLVEEAGGKFFVRKRGEKYDMICGKKAVVNWLVKHFGFSGIPGRN